MWFFINYKYHFKFDLLCIPKGDNLIVDDLILKLSELHVHVKLKFQEAQGCHKKFVDALRTKHVQLQVIEKWKDFTNL